MRYEPHGLRAVSGARSIAQVLRQPDYQSAINPIQLLYNSGMCRNIQQLRGAEPPATSAEIRDAALQFVRKVSGFRKPSAANAVVFESAVDEVAEAVHRLLDELVVAPSAKPTDIRQRRTATGTVPTT